MKTKAAPKTAKPALRAAQQRILATLAKADKPMTRAEIAEAAKCDQAGLVEMIGSPDPKKRAANDAKHFPSLLTLGLLKEGEPTAEGTVRYVITAKGRKAVEKLAAE
jgi:hypothetical protein